MQARPPVGFDRCAATVCAARHRGTCPSGDHVQLSVLGPLEVTRGGIAIPLGALKLRALLLSLVLDRGRVVPADRLVAQLWPDEPPPQPMVSLRSYVSNLRRLLQDPGGDPLIVTRSGGYLLDLAPDRVDAHRFERGVQEARAALAVPAPSDALTLLTDALSLWRGGAFADIAGEAHALPTITKLEELRLSAIEDRFDALLELGQHVEVVPELEAFTRHHAARERPTRQLMLALYRSARTPEALEVAARYRARLVDEYGLDPSPQLARLADRILRQDPDLDPRPSRPVRAPRDVAGVTVPAPATAAVTSTLIGRTTERRRLERSLAGLSEGRGGVLLLAGEPGIGKTAVLEELGRLAEAAGVPVAWGRGVEQEGTPPFWPWLEVLRMVATQLDGEALRRALAPPATPVTQLVPELAELVGREPAAAGGDPDAARFALYEAVTTFLARVAAERGLIVVLDDLHWADPASLQLAAVAAPRAADHRLVLAASFRDAPTDRSPELDAALAAAVRHPATATLELRPLTRDEVGAMIAEVGGAEPSDEVVADVYRRADGNPFFVQQLAALLAESDATARERPAIPVGVRHVLLRRLQPLTPAVRATLDLAAVFGQDFDARLVAQAAASDVLTILDHVDVAIGHGLVEVGGAHASAYRFVHALVRETLYDELSPGATARGHAAAAAALERLDPPPVQAVAEHLWLAADVVPAHRAVPYLRAAADEATAVLAYEQAEAHLQRALELLARDPQADARTELGVRLRLVQVMTRLHGWTAGVREDVSGRVHHLAGRAGIGAELVPLWWSLWSTTMTRGDLQASKELAAELLAEAVKDGDPASLVAGHVATAYTDLFAGAAIEDVRARLVVAAEAEAAADPDALARTPEHLGLSRRVTVTMTEAIAGEVAATLAAAEEMVAFADLLANPFQQAYGHLFAAWGASLVDRHAVARSQAADGLAICDRERFRYLRLLLEPIHGWAAARCGSDAREQVTAIIRAVDDLAAAGQFHAVGSWLYLLAEVHLLAGDRSAATAAFDRADRLGETCGEQVYGALADRVRRLL
jgi:DNA-binding SARP family transcriptional activator